MKIQTKNVIICILSIASISVTMYLSHEHDNMLKSAVSAQTNVTKIIQRHMNGDMMHDAIRGDVSNGLSAMKSGNKDALAESLAELNAHAGIFVVAIEENLRENMPIAIKEDLGDVKNLADTYIHTAETILTSDNHDKAEAHMSTFRDIFGELEDKQAVISDKVLTWSDNLTADLEQQADRSATKIFAFQCFNWLLSMLLVAFAVTAIFRPQRQMIEAMQHIASGDINTDIPHTERTDEMGDMARSVQVFKENAQRVIDLAEEQKRQQQEASETRRKTREDLAGTFEANVKNVVEIVASAATEMEATSRSLAGIANTNKEKLLGLTQQIDGTTRNVQTVSSSASQLSAAINEINKQVAISSSATASAVDEARKADGTVQQLMSAAKKIGEVVQMINSIASQINLLALNATIEAARAGEAGKGFAVVASEVKNLATQTTKATEEIGQYIQSIQSATSDTVGAINNIGGKIREISEISTTIASAVEEQGAATRDIAHNVQQAAQSTEEVSRNAGEVSRASEVTEASAGEMTSATAELSRQAETLRREVDKFLVGIRVG